MLGNVLGDEDNGLLGGHDGTLIDTGSILGAADASATNPIIDLDLISEPRAVHQSGSIDVGILPQIDGHSLLDADLLSGSYGANNLLTADLGPDGFGPILTGTILGGGDNPLDLQLLGTPISDLLGGDGGLLGGLHL
ncbi:hypothetical protein [Manganibacter manganicus]|uniref:hypothetical protein n=1 Tax=Manganibacter manganicus TaxID=1873176 RepID=UPI00111809A2|nr:hypothetical protein [Pseudaminobacter manganicus]